MPRSLQSERRSLAKLRTELHAGPWAIDARHLGMLTAAIEAGDADQAMESLAFGRDGVASRLGFGADDECTTKIINGIAVIPVTGVLRDEVDYMVRWGGVSSYQLIERDFKAAMGNEHVKGVLFYMNSPGGSAIGCKRIGDLVFEARGGKPIRTFIQGICGSAAYYIATATDKIESTADSLVASVGTIFTHLEYSGLLKELGYGATVFTNSDSPKKGHGNAYEPLSEESRKTLQSFVESYGKPFIHDVARYRGITPSDVVARFGQGDAMRADTCVKEGVLDGIVDDFAESLESITKAAGKGLGAKASNTPVVSGNTSGREVMNARIKAQLFALGLIDSQEAPDAVCQAALGAWAKARGETMPSDEAKVLDMLQAAPKAVATATAVVEKPAEGTPGNTAKAPVDEQAEARLEDLTAAAEVMNQTLGYEGVSAAMVLDANKKKLNATAAMKDWNTKLAEKEGSVPGARVNVTGDGADRYAKDVVDAMVYRAGNKIELSNGAEGHISKPLWAVAVECLNMAGMKIDAYANREYIAEMAMQMGAPGIRHSFYSANEGRQYIQASGTPAARPGDFPNILSSLAQKYLDTIELDEDYSYGDISALLPGGLNDFKPELLVNKGIVEELDEVKDADAFEELGLQEEVLSYLFLRRFGNKWGWTPVLVANDSMNAFAEGMLGLEEAWQVTQNRLTMDLITSNPTLLDGVALFANRANTGTALNDNDVASGGAVPSDAQWGAMEAKYADIGGIGTGRRVRGTLNTWFGPTGTPFIEARRTFLPLSTGGLEPKSADTTANVGVYRGLVKLVPESELRSSSALKWYGLRSPTMLNKATIVRGYFNGFGQQGRRERWYDPERKTTFVSIEGRIAVAIKNWRYIVRNKGEA